MTHAARPLGGLLSSKGTATLPPEPAVRLRKGEGRRVSTTLPTDHFIRFKVYAVQHGLTGEQAIALAIERLIAED
jgi:hypothetical protein